ncbi:MAG: hypothetical protein II038_09810 [Lachnospiraceae bacterium]|nr:hypothetical protein [Lachnospiraceae bacterium]
MNNWDEFISDIKKNMSDGWFMAALTDEFLVDNFSELEGKLCKNIEKLLELRVFNSDMEYKAYRSDIGREFVTRCIKDAVDNRDTIEEIQILDIDTKASASMPNGYVQATGGGRYHLPINRIEDAKIKIKYYLEGKETGQARVADWRIVELMEGK